jgi:rubrerythrin
MATFYKNSAGQLFRNSDGQPFTVGKLIFTLETPYIYTERSAEDTIYLYISNYNKTDVTVYVTLYDTDDAVVGAVNSVILAEQEDVDFYLELASSVTQGYLEAYFTAPGFEDSAIYQRCL